MFPTLLSILIILTLWVTCINSANILVNDAGAGQIIIYDTSTQTETEVIPYYFDYADSITDVVQHPETGMIYAAITRYRYSGIYEYDTANNSSREIGQTYYDTPIDDISLDWINNNIYYVESHSSRYVKVVSIDDGNVTQTAIIDSGYYAPRRIVVDPRPSQGYFYVTSDSGIISRCNLEFDNCQRFYYYQNYQDYETGLTIDFLNDYLYYSGKNHWSQIEKKSLGNMTGNIILNVQGSFTDDFLNFDGQTFYSKRQTELLEWNCDDTGCVNVGNYSDFYDIRSISIAKYQDTDNYMALPFDCKISGCLNGGSCNDNGDCSCNRFYNSYYDYQCNEATYNCGNQCVSSHTVSDRTNVCLDSNQCLCKEGYHGQYCELQRVNAECGPDKMTLSISPYSLIGQEYFSGNIYLKNDSDFSTFPTDPNCIAYGRTLYSKVIYYDGYSACPYQLERSGEENTYKLYAYLQFDSRFRTNTDVLLMITCGNSEFNLESRSNVTVTESSNLSPILITTVDVHASGLSMSLKMNNYGSIISIRQGTTVNIGDKLYLVFEYSDTFTLRKCTASNYELSSSSVPNGGQTIVIMDEWCVTNDGLRIVTNEIQWFDSASTVHGGSGTNGNKIMRLDLSAFYFLGRLNSLFFSCTTCTDCQPFPQPECNNTLSSFEMQSNIIGQSNKRKRRAADDVIDQDINLDVSVTVGNEKPQTQDCATNLDEVSNESVVAQCYKQLSVLLPLCILTAMMICAMSMTFCFCRRATQKNKEKTPPPYKS